MTADFPVEAHATLRISAPAAAVYGAWLDPAQIGEWMFGPRVRDERIISLTADVRVGGDFAFVVERQGAEVAHIGRYLELEPPRRLAFTWAIAPDPPDESRVIVKIAVIGSGCEVTAIHQMKAEWAEFRPRAEQAWSKMLASLAALLQRPAPGWDVDGVQLQRVRRICAAFPETEERISHGEPTFFVRKKVFAMFATNHHNDQRVGVWVPAPPGKQGLLLSAEPAKYYRPPHVGPRGWIGLDLGAVSDDELQWHIEEAWRMVAPKRLQASSRAD